MSVVCGDKWRNIAPIIIIGGPLVALVERGRRAESDGGRPNASQRTRTKGRLHIGCKMGRTQHIGQHTAHSAQCRLYAECVQSAVRDASGPSLREAPVMLSDGAPQRRHFWLAGARFSGNNVGRLSLLLFGVNLARMKNGSHIERPVPVVRVREMDQATGGPVPTARGSLAARNKLHWRHSRGRRKMSS